MPIEISDYRATWPAEFSSIAGHVRAVLGDAAVRIDHIGSTSVPGLAGKDRIDLQVSVASPAMLAPGLEALVAAGYRAWPEGSSDHVPPGGGTDPRDWVKRLVLNPAGSRAANVHIRVLGAPNQRYPLLFRDYLRTHGRSADAYGALKRGLAAVLDDTGRYAEIKDPACDLIAFAAEEWASVTAWDPGPSDA